ncbi:MAG: substrate-binding domain-containing protein [Solirubrobacteraceae bacterium]|nr:substrate-binding domain-containing protein [Solirubrobacteraceae bacterium]
MSRPTSRRALTVAASAACLAVAGCGVSSDGAMRELEQAQSETGTQNASSKGSAKPLPQPTPGEARIAGLARGSFTPLAVDRYRTAGGTTQVTIDRGGEARAFRELCAGNVDIADSGRPITRAELTRCREAGLTPVQLTVAADAVVVATKAGSDVGADCLPVGQVREIYRAGSPIYDWGQLGYTNTPMEVGGPSPSSEAFTFFGHTVLDAAEPSLTDVRSDYRVAADDRQNRLFVTGNEGDARVASQRELVAARLEAQQTRATKAAQSQRAATAELVAARRDQRKGIADGRSAAARAKASQRVRTAERALAQANAYVASAKRDVARGKRATTAAVAATRRQSQLRGRISYFRFSYYELYEEELRPLEIAKSDGAGRSCVFPSQDSVTNGSYPLARQLLLTTTTASLARAEVKTLLTAYLRRAREIAAAQRLVPVPEQRIVQQLGWVSGNQRPTIVVDPSAPGSVRESS